MMSPGVAFARSNKNENVFAGGFSFSTGCISGDR